jgi:membrane glycosyltransferase
MSADTPSSSNALVIPIGLQTVPALIGQKTLFARLQQFASRVLQRDRGVAAW